MLAALLPVLSPTGSEGQTSAPPGGGITPAYPGYHLLRINELQPDNRATTYNALQQASPWVEIYNPGDTQVLLDGFALTDTYRQLRRWHFPPGLVIAPGQYLVVWMDGATPPATALELHAGFRLKPGGGSLALTMLYLGRPQVVDYVDYPEVPADLSYGLGAPGASGGMSLLIRPTPGAANILLPTVILNEWFVTPPNEAGWFELYNPSGATVDLTGLVVTLTAIDLQAPPLIIPKGHSLPPHGFLKVSADGQAGLNTTGQTPLHAPFLLPSRAFTLQVLLPTGLPVSRADSKASLPQLPEARYPDGAQFYESVNFATPGAPNVGRPQFRLRPQPAILRTGESLTWTAALEGTTPIDLQWYRNEIPIAGATQTTLNLGPLAATDSGSYMLIARNLAGQNNTVARLVVNDPPTVLIDLPQTLTIAPGKTFQLPAVIAGTGPFTYQWRHNGILLPQETGPTLLRTLVGAADGGSYTLIVLNAAGVVQSIPVRVLIDVPTARFVSDSFAERLDLGLAIQGSVRGTTLGATRETGEPLHGGNAGGHSVWFKWVAPKPGILRLDTHGSTFDTLLGVYTGQAVNALKRIATDDDSGGFYTSEVALNVTAGTSYAIAIDGFGGAANEFILTWSFESTGSLLPVILRQPDSLTVLPGSTATFSVTASANTAAYQWFFNGVAIRGAIDSKLTLAGVGPRHVGVYTVAVTSQDQLTVVSTPARLELGDLPRAPSQDKYEPATQPFILPRLADDGGPELADVAPISVAAGTIGTQTIPSAGAGGKIGEPPPPCGAVGGKSRFQKFVLSQPAEMIIDTVGSTYNTVLVVYSVGKTPSFNYVACNKNGTSSEVRFQGIPGNTYYAFVDSADGSDGVAVLNWRVGGLPVLVTPAPPLTNTVSAGASFTLPASYSAAPAVTNVSWLLNNTPTAVSGDSFPVTGAGADDTGLYSIVLANAMGSVTGLVANICVNIPFELSASLSGVPVGDDLLIQGLAEQGFLVETSTDLVHWCAFGLNAVPMSPFSYTVLDPKSHPRIFFRCHPWPVDPSYTVTPCAPGYP